VRLGRRTEWLLLGLAAVVATNGVLLALSLYAILAFLAHLIGEHGPGIGWALLAGSIGGAALLWRAERQAKATQERRRFESPADRRHPAEARLLDRIDELTARTSLSEAPELRTVSGEAPNAWAVSREGGAAIILTEGLLEQLGPAEQDAVVAHQLAHVESEDLETVGLADAIAVTTEDLALAKSEIFWSPSRILLESSPFLAAWGLLIVFSYFIPKGAPAWWVILLSALVALGLLALWVWMALISWRGILQGAALIFFLGPLTVVELLLAPPTAWAISRFVSRERILVADERAVELTEDPAAAIAALERVQELELYQDEELWLRIRYSLYVTGRARSGWRGWRERIYSTHPSVATRIARLRETQERSRPEASSHPAAGTLEQSG
jgi:heat shock protein HtpX